MNRYQFDAALQRSRGWGAYIFFPHSTQEEFGTRGRVPVQAIFSGLTYTGSLMPVGGGHHSLSVPRTLCDQLGKVPGDLIRVQLWRDDAPRKVAMPETFTKMLREQKLLATFQALSITRRKEYRNWIASAKREETRVRRIQKSAEMLRKEIKIGGGAF